MYNLCRNSGWWNLLYPAFQFFIILYLIFHYSDIPSSHYSTNIQCGWSPSCYFSLLDQLDKSNCNWIILLWNNLKFRWSKIWIKNNLTKTQLLIFFILNSDKRKLQFTSVNWKLEKKIDAGFCRIKGVMLFYTQKVCIRIAFWTNVRNMPDHWNQPDNIFLK